jgi:hypothetical protein
MKRRTIGVSGATSMAFCALLPLFILNCLVLDPVYDALPAHGVRVSIAGRTRPTRSVRADYDHAVEHIDDTHTITQAESDKAPSPPGLAIVVAPSFPPVFERSFTPVYLPETRVFPLFAARTSIGRAPPSL